MADSGYTIEDMERWVAKAEANIARLQEGIAAEEHQIEWAKSIIADLKAKQEEASGIQE